ncbi:MAG: site-specific DNA-methyltransferase [Methylibium sp.]|nr:site-specific DNA-methyltransferase [Methylibium sp.]
MSTLPEASVDSIVTDPPYELGFMGKSWDSTGVANDVNTWREALRVLKPGGHLLAFSGTRTYHRMVCAIEDAGFEIRDQIGWAYGSGFPKSHNGEWGGTALKPAWEPICMARKPLIGTVAANVLAHGTGALNIDGCRVEFDGDTTSSASSAGLGAGHEAHNKAGRKYGNGLGGIVAPPHVLGRWPANLIHDGSDEVLAAFPQARSSGHYNAKDNTKDSGRSFQWVTSFSGAGTPSSMYSDSGSAARFFYTAKANGSDRNDGGQRVTGNDRNSHPTVKPTDLMRYLCRLVTPKGGTVLDPFMGSGSTMKAAELEGFDGIGIELDPAYIDIARRRIAADAPLFAEVEAA